MRIYEPDADSDELQQELRELHGRARKAAGALDALLEGHPEGAPLVSLAGGQGDAEPEARESAAASAKTETSD